MAHITDDRIVETSTSTGTGNLVLAGAVAGFRTIASKAVDGTLFSALIEAVDSNGVPTGEWETTIAKYNSGANSITRQAVSKSSNADALVNFSAGTKRIYLALLSDYMYQEGGIPFKRLESLSPGFAANYFWGFLTDTESWVSSNSAAVTVAFDSTNGKGVLVTDISTTTLAAFRSPAGLSIDGNKNRVAKISLTLTANPNNEAIIIVFRYVTGGHGMSASFQSAFQFPKWASVGDTYILDFDMETATGAPDWQTNTITQIQFILHTTPNTGLAYRVNWVGVGENRPVDKTFDNTQTAASSAAGKLKVSASADRKIADYSGVSALLKVDASSVVANASVGTDYSTLGLQLAAILP